MLMLQAGFYTIPAQHNLNATIVGNLGMKTSAVTTPHVKLIIAPYIKAAPFKL